jgi:hypothetical protein
MNPIIDLLIAWQIGALLIVTVLAVFYLQWTRARLAAFLLVAAVAFGLQVMAVLPLLQSDAKRAVVAEKTEWTTDMRQGWSLR